jgi:type VI secretion system protein ImpE
MQQAQVLYREGRLTESIDSLRAHLRDCPSDKRARSFLFELLCFAGEFDRARKQLMILAEDSKDSRLGVAFYFAALAAEVERQAYYEEGIAYEAAEGPGEQAATGEITGTFNGKRFTGIRDLDSRLGGSLEFLAAGKYHRIRFGDVKRIEIAGPKHVRDLYWLPAKLEMTEAMGSAELESILVPVLYPQTHLFDDDRTRLGRATEWAAIENGMEIPLGQRVLAISGEEVPLLEVRSIEFDPRPEEAGKVSNG